MNKKIIQRFKYNNQTGQWEIIHSDDDFVELNPHSLAAIYAMDPEFRKNVIKTAETLREALIEEAVERSDLREAKQLIEWVKNGRSSTGSN